MVTAFARLEGRSLSVSEIEAAQEGLKDTLQEPWFKAWGYACSEMRRESLFDLVGGVFECEAPRDAETQVLRMRILVGQEGVLFQAVTWTKGAQTEHYANRFWESLQQDSSRAPERPTANAPMAMGAIPLESMVKAVLR